MKADLETKQLFQSELLYIEAGGGRSVNSGSVIGISCIANQLLVLVMLLFDLNPQLRVPVVSPGSRTLIMMDGGVFLRDFSCFQLIEPAPCYHV